eukprot:7984694-Pyramimonas_sp.AAC.1
MQVPARLTTEPQYSACLGKRGWPRHAPAPVANFQAMGASKRLCHAPLSHCSKRRYQTSRQRRSLQQVPLLRYRAAPTCCPLN